MGFFGRPKKQSKDGKERESNLLFSSEHSPSETFDLSSCDMISIPSGVFSTCKNLRKKTLNLSNNRLASLGDEDLQRLCGLLELNLDGNNIKSLPKDVSKLANLRVLRLSNNPKLSSLHGIESLSKLEELYISGTDISTLDNSLASLKALSVLELGEKTTFPVGDHEKTINLIMTAEQHPGELLDLADCGLWKPPKGIYFKSNQLRKRRISLSKNHLVTICDDDNGRKNSTASAFAVSSPTMSSDDGKNSNTSSLTYATGVSSLDISYNCLSTIPPEISNFISLQLLDISFNQLRSLPAEIGTLVRLEYLNISNNPKLETFPPSLSNLVKLRLFDITCTGIRHIPAEFDTAKLPELTDFRHDLDPSGASSPSSPSSGSFSYKSEPDGVIDIFAQQAEKEKREFLAAVAHREAQDEEEQKAYMIRERSNAQEVAQQLKYREMEIEREHKELHRLQEKEQKKLREELLTAKEESDKLLASLLDSDRIRKEQEDLIDFLRRNEAEEAEYFKITEEEQAELDQDYINEAMKFLLQQEEDLSQLLVTIQKKDEKNQEVIQNFLKDQNTNLLVPTDDINHHMCLEEFETLQRIACQKLLEQRDDELAGLRKNTEEIKRELQDLTALELKKQETDQEINKEWLEDRRLELSGLLGQFLKQETEREGMAKTLLGKMEDQREQDQATFWLVQFQRLLQEKPLALRRMETELEPEVLEIIQRANVTDSIECFATHRISWHQLRAMTDKDLERTGLYRLGDRKRVLDEVKKGATGILIKANAPGQKDIESNLDQSGPSTTSGTAPENIPIINTSHTIVTPDDDNDENECCICMDATRQLVFLPCGHVCTCRNCGEPVVNCPLCRADITQKINLFR